MLIINEDLLAIDASLDRLVKQIMNLEQVKDYQAANEEFISDNDLQEKISRLDQLKTQLLEEKDYIPYRPELKEKQRKMRHLQKDILLEEQVFQLKLAENALQEVLDIIAKEIVHSVSDKIEVDEGLLFSKGKDKKHQGGHCGK